MHTDTAASWPSELVVWGENLSLVKTEGPEDRRRKGLPLPNRPDRASWALWLGLPQALVLALEQMETPKTELVLKQNKALS